MTEEAERAELKDTVAGAIGSVLDKIDRENRQPDAWERAYLVAAISMLFRGVYTLAGLHTTDAATSPSGRGRHTTLPDLPPYDTNVLRRALGEAIAEPLREWPHFGPIAFKPDA